MDRRSVLKGGVAALVAAGLPSFARASGISSNFHAIYGDPRQADRFFLFLQNIFHLFPEAEFHQLILDALPRHADDEGIYREVQAGLSAIKTVGSEITYAMPALARQKREMARQTSMLLEADGRSRYDGYLEIGTTGRYVKPIQALIPVEGPVFLMNDVAPGTGPVDVLERGSLTPVGEFQSLGDYDRPALPDASVDLVTNFIGFHHCPPERLPDFLDGIRAVLRPGGRLVVRDHDVPDAEMHTFVALAHDVFNAGVYLSWEENAAQLRHFKSKETWTELLRAAGFERDDRLLAQAHDPTDNVLMTFKKA